MKTLRSPFAFALISAAIVLFSGCKTEEELPEPVSTVAAGHTTGTHRDASTLCGSPFILSLLSPTGVNVGTVLVGNDADMLYATFTPAPGLTLAQTNSYAGLCADLPTTATGNFTFSESQTPGTTTATYAFTLASVGVCPCIAFYCELTDASGATICAWAVEDETNAVPGAPSFSRYCKQDCEGQEPPAPAPPVCQVGPGSHQTYTQLQWGACGGPASNYLTAHFAAAFPTGVSVGCATNKKLRLTTVNAIHNFLPSSGTPRALTSNLLNPSSYGNTLAGHTVALALNLGFDANDANYCASPTPLAELVISAGTFQGWTVQQLFTLANNSLGNCGTSGYTYTQISNAVAGVNEAFLTNQQSGWGSGWGGGGWGGGGWGGGGWGGGGGNCGGGNNTFTLVCP